LFDVFFLARDRDRASPKGVKLRVTLLLAAIGLGLLAPPAQATPVDPSFAETPFLTFYPRLTALAWAPDGSNRLFVVQKTGRLWIVENGQILTTPFATLTPVVVASECGMLGIAFDPDFVTNGYVYVFATVSVTEQQIIRYTAVGNTGTDKTVIVAGLPTAGVNHDGGALGFGPDGKIYWAVGDNGNKSGTKDDLLSLAAKVGRANPDGSAPADNPFFDGDGPNNDYIWARGFRNPFTLTFQPGSGRLWLNVVGNELEQIFALKAGDHGGWDTYEGNQPKGFVLPRVSYYTGRAPSLKITGVVGSGAVRAAGVTTITTLIASRFRPGVRVTIAGVADPSFDGTAFVETSEGMSFSFKQAGPDAKSEGGTVTSELVGNAVTGGEFWSSSGVPAEYRGDLLFGDYGSGNLMRVRLDENEGVKSIDKFITGAVGHVDMAVGPDGNLYYGTHAGSILRASYIFDHQALVVTPLDLRMAEGGKAVVNVRLAQQPASDVEVKVAHSSGDEDVSVTEGGTLMFTTQNWQLPQRVLLGAAQDADSAEDIAAVRVSAAGLPPEVVTVRVTDDDGDQPEGSAGQGGALSAGGAASAGAAAEAAGAIGGEPLATGGEPAAVGGEAAAVGGEAAAVGGEPAAAGGGSKQEASCGCRLPPAHGGDFALWAGVLGLVGLAKRRQQRGRGRGAPGR
jgi:glucose/arabinose dehydrogenase